MNMPIELQNLSPEMILAAAAALLVIAIRHVSQSLRKLHTPS